MVLCLKTWESRSPPGLQKTNNPVLNTKQTKDGGSPKPPLRVPITIPNPRPAPLAADPERPDAGWSSPVARQAHNLKVTGSNPVPATKHQKPLQAKAGGVFAA